MSTYKKQGIVCQGTVAVLALTLAGAAYAADDTIAQLTQPESAISVGGAAVSGDPKERAIWGQYNGMRDQDAYFLLDFDFIKRDDKTGTWTNIMGRNLGLDTRELGFSMNRQGDWKVGLDYSELVHREIRTINTGLIGAGTTTPQVVRLQDASGLGTPGSGSDLNLEMKRKKAGVDVDKWINPAFQVQFSFKNEDKDGARLWGRGYECASYVCATGQSATNQRWATLMLPEPVNSNIKQIEAKMNYRGQKLGLTGGYYGSIYTNYNGNLQATVPGSLNNAFNSTGLAVPLSAAAAAGVNPAGGTSLQNVLQLPMALPPDNQAHQLYLTGDYAFTPTTRSNFKLSYTHATQDENFGGAGLFNAPAGVNDLGGKVDTTLAQFGMTAQPLPKFSVVGNVRYEDRNDKTPIQQYNVENTTFWYNAHDSRKKLDAKLEGSYLLPGYTRVTLGIDYNSIDRELPSATTVDIAGLSGLREKNEEWGYRAELRRSVSDTLTGAISYGQSRREGTDWYNLCTSAACTAQGLVYGNLYPDAQIWQRTAIFPYMFSDRTRQKVRASADWAATERLGMQFIVESSSDHYGSPTTKGLRDGRMQMYSIDASYSLSDAWKLTAYASRGDQHIRVDHSTGYMEGLNDTNDAIGIGLVGKPSGRYEFGGNISYINDRNAYQTQADFGASANNAAQIAAYQLPDVVYRESRLNLYGKYSLDKHSDIRVDFVYADYYFTEWAWGAAGVPYTYSDNTTVSMDPKQHVAYIGARYIYRMR
jgi:MtrB/PioB family decaheme-associated outer membrane protein